MKSQTQKQIQNCNRGTPDYGGELAGGGGALLVLLALNLALISDDHLDWGPTHRRTIITGKQNFRP